MMKRSHHQYSNRVIEKRQQFRDIFSSTREENIGTHGYATVIECVAT